MFTDSQDFLLSSYNYELDQSLIAQKPFDPRHQARMMVVKSKKGLRANPLHLKVWDLVDQLKEGDLLVMNNTRVLRARLRVRLSQGSLAELLLLEPQGDGRWLCLAKPAKKMRPGDALWVEANEQAPYLLKVIDIDQKTGGRIIKFPSAFNDREKIEGLLKKYGEIPLPPYIHKHDASDIDRYQTRYASSPGAIAAPTAGLHLSDQLLEALSERGICHAYITLHVGLGTFRPLNHEDLNDLQLHSEWVEVKEEVVSAIEQCRSRGGRVIAVGTTTVRSLEAAFLRGRGQLKPLRGSVDLVIKPGFKFGVIDGLLTNFHLPKSSLLLLVSALIGRENLLELYKQAIEKKYRFFSYGDAMFVSPEEVIS